MMNSFAEIVSNIPRICSTQKCKMSQEEAFCSAKCTRNGGRREIIELFSVSQGHNLDWNTLWVLLGDVHTPIDPELSQGKCAGWTMGLLQHRAETSPPAQWLGHSLPLPCKDSPGLIIRNKVDEPAPWQPVWRSGIFSLGGIRAALWQGQGLYGCSHQVCCGGFQSFPLITAH